MKGFLTLKTSVCVCVWGGGGGGGVGGGGWVGTEGYSHPPGGLHF